MSSQKYGFILLTGNTLDHTDEIIGMIRQQPALDIIRIVRHQYRDARRFARWLYGARVIPEGSRLVQASYLIERKQHVLFIFIKGKSNFKVGFTHNKISTLGVLIRRMYCPWRVEFEMDHEIYYSSSSKKAEQMTIMLGLELALQE